jgi:tetratricopeptide (TPR) repeat protein
MKKILIIALSFFALNAPAKTTMADDITDFGNRWMNIHYTLEQSKKFDAISKLEKDVNIALKEYPQSAEIKIWAGIVISEKAGIRNNVYSLGDIKQAKEYFEQAIKIDDKALNGAAYTSLGTLYYMAPAWPISFGDNKKAKINLQKGLAIGSNDIDANFFYADYLRKQGDMAKAKHYFNIALNIPVTLGKEVGNLGRKEEINKILADMNKK